jgi:signal transduction histidine kinase
MPERRASLEMPTPPNPPGFEEIQRQELSRLYGHVVAGRLVFVPLVMALAIALAFHDPAGWRRILLSASAAVFVTFFVVEYLRFRRLGAERLSIPLNLGAAALGQSLVTLGTGGLSSPFAMAMVPLALIFGLNLRAPLLATVVLYQELAVAAFAALALTGAVPDLNLLVFGGGAAAANPWHVVADGAMLAALLLVGAAGGRGIRRVFDGMVRKALVAQDESLRSHRERAEELSALSAEIAHELKNPLASVKGLAGLLAQDPAGPRAADRLAVLRREVDRMQGILDEFLNFSRPLVPLALGRVDLSALCHEVVALHEGMAQERGLSLAVRATGSARCDPRKVKQIVINLVQNAIDASPQGAAVEIEAAEGPAGEAGIRVLDRGQGIDPGLGEKVFEPGVTTKARGSGIGLTVARALARQHGGDLALAARPGGGCAAELRLPAAGPAARPGEAA